MGIEWNISAGDGADWPGDWHAALAALAWQADLGVTEAVGDVPVNRYDLPAAVLPAARAAMVPDPALPAPFAAEAPVLRQAAAVDAAGALAGRAQTLDDLRAAMAGYDQCDLKRGARNLVFAGGQVGAAVLILTDPPNREDDVEGQPFAGQPGQLLDRMLAAIGLDRGGVYIVPALPWRPPADRAPEAGELAMMRPFVDRHIALAAPRVMVTMGTVALRMLTGQAGLSRLRGQWLAAGAVPLLPMLHPADLIRNPAAKREAWADLLAVKARLG
ncbi:MAG: uracil-DNA glycosylase [Pseudomonadota bacterium]